MYDIETHTHKKQQLTFIHLRRDGANFWLLWSAELGLTAGIAVTQDALRPAGEFRCALTRQRLEPSVGFYRFWAELEPLLDCQTRLKTDSNSSRSKWRQSGTQSPRDRPTGELRTCCVTKLMFVVVFPHLFPPCFCLWLFLWNSYFFSGFKGNVFSYSASPELAPTFIYLRTFTWAQGSTPAPYLLSFKERVWEYV